MVKKRKSKTDLISKKEVDYNHGVDCPETENKTKQNGGHSQLALETTTDCLEDEMTKSGQKRKSTDITTDSSKLLKIADADETEIQASSISQSEAKEGGKYIDNTVEQENSVPCIVDKDFQEPEDIYDKSLESDTTCKSLEETEVSENAVKVEIRDIITEFRTTFANNMDKVLGSFVIGSDESKEGPVQHTSDKEITETVVTESIGESSENVLQKLASHLHENILDEKEENYVADSTVYSLSNTCTAGKTDIDSSNEKAITFPDNGNTEVIIGNVNIGLDTKATLDNEKDARCNELKLNNNIEITSEASQTAIEMMHTDSKTKVTCQIELHQEETDAHSKMNGSSNITELAEVEKENIDDSDLKKCPEKQATEDKIVSEISLETTTEQKVPCKEMDKTEKHYIYVEFTEDKDTFKEREALGIDKLENENEMAEEDKNEDDVDSIQSQPVSHIDEDIYLQSTAPVKLESSDSEHEEGSTAEEVLETGFETLLPGSQLPVAREVVAFMSPRPADEAPQIPGNLVDDPVPVTANEVPEMYLDDPSTVLAAEAQVMEADTGDELTDSQLCAMDWSSQFPQEHCAAQQSIVKSSLPPPPTVRQIGPQSRQPDTRGKPEDGTAIMRGLIREVAQLNKMVLKTKREMETVKHQRQQTYNFNRR